MNYETQSNLKAILEGLDASITNINKLSSSVIRILETNEKGFKSTINNLGQMTNNLTKLTDSLNQMPLNSTVENFESTSTELKEIIKRINSGKGSAGLLLIMKNYIITVNSSKALDALLSDLKEHPKRYVHFSIFGRKEKSSMIIKNDAMSFFLILS